MTLWWAWVGRDPRPDSIVPAWRPPDGVGPGAAGALVDQRADSTDILATILDLAARGYIQIREVHPAGVPAEGDAAAAIARSLLENTGLWTTEWEFRRSDRAPDGLETFERSTYHGLFGGERAVTMSGIADSFRQRLPALYRALYEELVERGWFRHSPETTRREWRLLGGTVAILGAVLIAWAGLLDLGLGLLLSGAILAAFAPAMPVVTREGARVRDGLLGVREYVRRAERAEVEARHRDQRVPGRFEEILPYAISLGVIDLWLDEFAGLTEVPRWFQVEGAAETTVFSVHLGVFCAAAAGALGDVARSPKRNANPPPSQSSISRQKPALPGSSFEDRGSTHLPEGGGPHMGAKGTVARDRRIWFFGQGTADGGADDIQVLGGKGAHLHEMSRLGLPVPPGFTLPTGLCRLHLAGELPDGLRDEVAAAVARLGEAAGRRFGASEDPLLLSVRSGSPVSLPGMMDTVLNLGLSETAVDGLARRLGHPRFALDCRRRLIQMFGDVVAGIDRARFETLLDEAKRARGVASDAELAVEDLEGLIEGFLAVYREVTGEPFPEDPIEQLWRSILAVFDSWANPRAVTLREIEAVPHDLGTAANVQVMVFGNAGARSGSGVAFTRDPATGEPTAVGEYLPDAQGEDVVSGVRTPRPLSEAQRSRADGGESLEAWMPEAYAELLDVFATLERRYADMQDVEFTIEGGELSVLQTRRGKRTAEAMVRIAHDLAVEGRIDRKTAISRVDAARLDQLLHPTLAAGARPEDELLARGLGASPGVAAGRVMLDADEVLAAGVQDPVILVRRETSADDVGAMNASAGVLTARGGATSHAAVVARGMGIPCIVGCSALEIDRLARAVSVDGRLFQVGDWLTIDGATGEIFEGRLATTTATPSPEFQALMGWADDFRRLGVRANADTPADARRAIQFGAEGIGLCRTEHMFFAEDRIRTVREVVLAAAGRRMEPGLEASFRDALDRLLPSQRGDFEGIFAVMQGRPVTIRLLDPPLHEFLPREAGDLDELAERLGISRERVDAIVESLSEANPMLGHRGCRLGITDPEIYEMQVRAIVEAAANARAAGQNPRPEIMIPLVALPAELERLRERIDRVVSEFAPGLSLPIGTMIELPRAALVADRIAAVADFFSFGTNDLTQTTLGLSRDDAAGFLDAYREQGLLQRDPFVALDREGVGALIEIGVKKGRSIKPAIPIGLCGEHGGEPSSIEFCHRIGLDYVSCSPYRVPTARLAAAQAAIAGP